jgi:hypothetical protein
MPKQRFINGSHNTINGRNKRCRAVPLLQLDHRDTSLQLLPDRWHLNRVNPANESLGKIIYAHSNLP